MNSLDLRRPILHSYSLHMTTSKVLFLGANGRDTTRLRLGAEARYIRNELAIAGVGDVFNLVTELAVRPSDLQGLLLSHTPNIIHFSGHGSERRPRELSLSATTRSASREFMSADYDASTTEGASGGILLEDHSGTAVHVHPETLRTLLALLERDIPLRCVVLNACFTASQAETIAEHVDCVIGAAREIEDEAALAFATAFYRAIAHGKSVGLAFELGRNEIGLRGLAGQNVLQLFCRRGIAAENVFIMGNASPKAKQKAPALVMREAAAIAPRPAPYHIELHLTRMKGPTARAGLYDARLIDGESKGLDAIGVIDLGAEEPAKSLHTFVQNNASTDDVLAFGQQLLYRLLGDEDMRALWKEMQQRRAGAQRPLRLELVFPAMDAQSLGQIPFELLADWSGFFFRRPGSSFVRSVRGMAVRTLHLGPGDSILAAWANPRIDNDLLEAKHLMAHERKTQSAAGSLGLTVRASCSHATRAMLEERLTGQTAAIVSLVARSNARGLWLHRKDHCEYPNDPGELVSARDLAMILRRGHVGVALLWTPQTSETHPISAAMATTLLDPEMGDLTAVVTSNVELGREAHTMMERMLEALGNEKDLASAVGEGRRVLAESNMQWATTAYYARPRAGATVSFVEQVAQAVEKVRKASAAERGKPKSRGGAKTKPRQKPVRKRKSPEKPQEDSEYVAELLRLSDDRGAGIAGRFTDMRSIPRLADMTLDSRPPLDHPLPQDRTRVSRFIGPAPRNASSMADAVEIALELLYDEKILWVTGAPGSGKTALALEIQKLLDAAAKARKEGPRALYVSLDGVSFETWHSRWRDLIRQQINAVARKHDDQRPRDANVKQFESYTLLILDHAEFFSDHLGYVIEGILDGHPELSVLLVARSKKRADNWPVLYLEPLSPTASRALFLDSTGHRLTPEERDSAQVDRLIGSLEGHPLSLVMGAKLVGVISVASLNESFRKKSALDISLDWLAEYHPEAYEILLWLGHLPRGLPFVLIESTFGESGQYSRATLLRNGLATEWGPEQRLTLAPAFREHAMQRRSRLASTELRNQSLAIFHEITKWLEAFPPENGDWIRDEQIALAEINLKGVTERLATLPSVVDDKSTERTLTTTTTTSFDTLARILETSPNNTSRDFRTRTHLQQIADNLIRWMEPIVGRQLELWRSLAALYLKAGRVGHERQLSLRAAFASGNDDTAADVLLAQEVVNTPPELCWEILKGRGGPAKKHAATDRLVEIGRAYMKGNRWEDAGDIFLKVARYESGRVNLVAMAREIMQDIATDIPKNAARRYYLAFRLYETANNVELAAVALESSAKASMRAYRFADAEARYNELASLWSRLNQPMHQAKAEIAASEARERQAR